MFSVKIWFILLEVLSDLLTNTKIQYQSNDPQQKLFKSDNFDSSAMLLCKPFSIYG